MLVISVNYPNTLNKLLLVIFSITVLFKIYFIITFSFITDQIIKLNKE